MFGKTMMIFIAPPQTFGLKFGTRSGATCPNRERLLSFWRRQQALPPITAAPWPTPNRAAQWSMSATRTPSARSTCVSTRSGSIGSGQTGLPMGTFPLCREGEADRLLFATNAGMFDPALKPVGLYVEQGRELVHVNTSSGYGNFHMKPNGVFYISGDRAAITETRAFFKQRAQADLATQSGPMLVINGRLHPRF